jgi:hypothetical protein
MAQQQRGLSHHRGRLGLRIALTGEVMEDRARGRHHPARGQRVDRDVVRIEFGGQPRREPFKCRLAHSVHGPAEPGPAGVNGRMAGRPRGDVQDPARAAGAQARQHQRGQVERRLDLHREHQRVPLRAELLDRREPGDRRVVDQDVGRPEPRRGLLDQPHPVLRPRQVGRDRDRGPARRDDPGHGLVDRARERAGRAGRGARRHRHGRAVRAEPPGDLRPDPSARPGHQGHLSVQHGHYRLPPAAAVKDIFTERSLVHAAAPPAAAPASAADGPE